tara:strand:+ start:233 stop:439 length:207 start_codon:yes stop_codon:yes gene_type:complete
MILTQNPGASLRLIGPNFFLIGQVSFCPWDFAIGNGAATALLGLLSRRRPGTRRERAIKGTTHDEAFA